MLNQLVPTALISRYRFKCQRYQTLLKSPFHTEQKHPQTPTNIWLLSSVVNGTIGICSRVRWLCSSYGYLSAVMETWDPGGRAHFCYGAHGSYGYWCVNSQERYLLFCHLSHRFHPSPFKLLFLAGLHTYTVKLLRECDNNLNIAVSVTDDPRDSVHPHGEQRLSFSVLCLCCFS